MHFILRLLCGLLAVVLPASAADASKPNIVLIYADDVGYGDVGCYGATKIKTPNLDKLAAQGLRFTDAHSSSATCTPSRYSMLTGEYAFRKKGTGILPGDANLIIEPGRYTLPGMFQRAGYRTGVAGKWHLGLGQGKVDWNTEIKPGPREIGFHYSFLIPATVDRVPCVYVENQRVVGLESQDPIAVDYTAPFPGEPTGKSNPELLKMKLTHGHDMSIVNGISRIGHMKGGKAALWKDEDIADDITRKAVAFIEQNKDKPFFLFFPTHDVHVPRVPHPRFAGKSGCGLRGDMMEQLDWCVGELVKTLERLKLSDNTIVIFSSDNGPVLDDGYADRTVEDLNGHKPAGLLKGGKYSPYEGGTRVPFIVKWPAKIKPGTSEALICQVDLLASFASMLKQEVPASAPDSLNVLPALLGQSTKGRDHLVEQGGGLSLRQGQWKFIPAGQGGPRGQQKQAGPQLYNLAEDIGETKNLAEANPQRVSEMRALLNKLRGPQP